MEAGAGGKHLVNQVLRDAMPAHIIEPHLLQGMPQFGTERLQGAGDILEKGGQIQHGNGTVSDGRPWRQRRHGRCQGTHRKATSWARGSRIAYLAPSTIARTSTKRNGEGARCGRITLCGSSSRRHCTRAWPRDLLGRVVSQRPPAKPEACKRWNRSKRLRR